MRLDRREFVRIGALGGVGALSGACQSACLGGGAKLAGNALRIQIKGLCLVERLQKAVAIHTVNSGAITSMMLAQHNAYLSVPTADIVVGPTNAASITDPADAARTAFTLTGNVTLDSGNHGAPDLTRDEDPVNDQIPANADDWKSINLGARLSTICGSTKIIAPASKFTAHVTLEHGHLRALKPEGGVGPVTVWTFTHTPLGGTPQQVAKQPMTNLLLCTVNVPGNTQPTFTIGAQKLVLKRGAKDVVLKNLPDPSVKGQCSSNVPCVDHMAAYYELVDKQFSPDVVGVPVQLISPSADPDYCPPGV